MRIMPSPYTPPTQMLCLVDSPLGAVHDAGGAGIPASEDGRCVAAFEAVIVAHMETVASGHAKQQVADVRC